MVFVSVHSKQESVLYLSPYIGDAKFKVILRKIKLHIVSSQSALNKTGIKYFEV